MRFLIVFLALVACATAAAITKEDLPTEEAAPASSSSTKELIQKSSTLDTLTNLINDLQQKLARLIIKHPIEILPKGASKPAVSDLLTPQSKYLLKLVNDIIGGTQSQN